MVKSLELAGKRLARSQWGIESSSVAKLRKTGSHPRKVIDARFEPVDIWIAPSGLVLHFDAGFRFQQTRYPVRFLALAKRLYRPTGGQRWQYVSNVIVGLAQTEHGLLVVNKYLGFNSLVREEVW